MAKKEKSLIVKLNTEERLKILANMIIDRILEEKEKGKIQLSR